jgi:hypothetical protein
MKIKKNKEIKTQKTQEKRTSSKEILGNEILFLDLISLNRNILCPSFLSLFLTIR